MRTRTYSNSGYILLGYLIEDRRSKLRRSSFKKNIFAPLGMKDSGYDSNSAIISAPCRRIFARAKRSGQRRPSFT